MKEHTATTDINHRKRSCLFTGHRTLPKAPEELKALEQKVTEALKEAYKKGYRTFYSGGAVGFDLLCALTVLNMKHTALPEARLVFALPCYNHYKSWSKEDKRLLANLLEMADEVVYVSEKYRPGCMHKRNRYMVDRSDLCIAYCLKKTGGTAYTVGYAQKQKIAVNSLAAT